jgi:hypothetical protein
MKRFKGACFLRRAISHQGLALAVMIASQSSFVLDVDTWVNWQQKYRYHGTNLFICTGTQGGV